MKIIGFIGPSGSGKSHRALWVARERGVDCIIDDGLLIIGNRVVAGISAKKEATRIGSIKRALFVHPEHAESVKKTIDELKPSSIMILGTSDGMIDSISERLGYSVVDERVYINEVANDFEIKQALTTRREQGKHVIPVPTFEIKKDFSGYFLDPLQIFRRKGKGSYQLVGEKSVVRPTFSYLGNYTISDYTIFQIVEYTVADIKGVSKITRFRAENRPDGISIELDLNLILGHSIMGVLKEVRQKVREKIEKLTALNIYNLDISAKSIVFEDGKKVAAPNTGGRLTLKGIKS
ncbi:MAG: hypothetical protein Q7J78_05165 [Clostridiales bacterium]|nr:hypothetical protein [Clostridiales bacterium]